jgi:hypothetical protein
MPPASTATSLAAAEIAVLRRWIEQGAEWQKHWSFLPPVKKQGTIDTFVRARLEKEGLRMSPPADRETLLRRVTLDLTGLPPSVAELDAFLKDRSQDAYEKSVDRLLASPRFGEHMAARWLDAARYADTNGYQYDGERVMWRWRDYVIESFNKNKPFDVFAREQIAGDMLPGAGFEQHLATGFSRNHRGNTEDGIVPEEYAVEYVVDRVETTSAAFLGLTLGCARCHNHKYDPFTQKEFYQLFAYFNNVPERGRAMKYGNSPPLIPAPTAAQQSELSAMDAKIAMIESQLRALAPRIRQEQMDWEKSLASRTPAAWSPYGSREAALAFDDGGAPGRLNGSKRFDGDAPLPVESSASKFDIETRFSISAWVKGEGTIASVKASDDYKGKGIALHVAKGRVAFHIVNVWETDALRVVSEEPIRSDAWHHVAVTYTGSRMAEDAILYIDGRRVKTRIDSDTLYRPFRNAGGKFNAKLVIGGGAGREQSFRGWLDEVRVYSRPLRAEEIARMADGQPLHLLAAQTQRSANVRQQLELAFLETAASPQIRDLWLQAAKLKDQRERFAWTFPTSMTMAESPVRKKTHLLMRGAYDKPGEEVEPGLPAALPGLPPGAPNDRLGFAMWLTDRSNPLTARVVVNRFWQSIFGTGIVKTAEDFGQQGEWPSHPELLDWLAVEFMDSGWNVKQILRTILVSDTYRQSSRVTPELLQRDPDNRLLARGPRIRLSAEMIRDGALLQAGLLHEQLGGPSVKPYQPEGLWKEVIMQDFEYVQAKGPDLYRRSLYTFWKRTAAPPMMMNFDASQREACMVRENRTNTPLQALNLMNDVTFLEAARFIGQRMMKEGGAATEDRLRHGFRIVMGRSPAAREMEVLRGSYAYHLDYFASKPKERGQLLAHGDTPSDPRLDATGLAACMSVASLLLNTDEAITKE